MLNFFAHRFHLWLQWQSVEYYRRRMHLGTDVVLRPGLSVYKPRNIHIGNSVSIAVNCVLQAHGPISIDDFTLIGPDCVIVTASHDIHERGDKAFYGIQKKAVRIGRECWLGSGVIVLPGVTIGDYTVVAAGSVVSRDLPPGKICMGIPARPVKDRPAGPPEL